MESSEEVGKKIVAKTLHVFDSSHIHFLKPYKSNINYLNIIIPLNLGLFSSDIFILRFVDIVGILNLSLYISSRRFKMLPARVHRNQADPVGNVWLQSGDLLLRRELLYFDSVSRLSVALFNVDENAFKYFEK